MKSRFAAILGIIIITGSLVPSFLIFPCSADMLLMAYMTEGAAVHNGTHIVMPEVEVRVNITRTGSTMFTNMRADFLLMTNMTQNATLGFIPPMISTLSSISDSQLSIALNDTEIEYSFLDWEDLGVDQGFSTILSDLLGTWVETTEYAVFNVQLFSDIPIIITATSNSSQELSVNGVSYDYITASARTFEGHTHEVVHMQLVENTPFLNVNFQPDDNLILTKEGIQTDAVWDMNVSEFEWDRVRMQAMVNEYHPTFPISSLVWLILPAVVIIILLVVLITRRWGISR